MDKSNKIENLANKYVERHIRDRHLAVIGMDGDRLNGRVFQLSPLFVEEMMGYPLMWTTLPFLTGNGEKNQ